MRKFDHRVNYDPALDPSTWRDGYNPRFAFLNMKGWKKDLAHSRRTVAIKKKLASVQKLEEKKRLYREAAEEDAAALVRQIVAALEMAMDSLNTVAVPRGQFDRAVNVKRLHNVLMELRTKCGIYFEPNEFDQRVNLDPGSAESNELNTQAYDRENQRQARLRNARETAARVAKFINDNRTK